MSSKRRKYRTFSRNFKLEAVKRVIDGGATQTSLEKEYSLADGTLHRWLSEYFQHGEKNVWTKKRGRRSYKDKSKDELTIEILKKFNSFLDKEVK